MDNFDPNNENADELLESIFGLEDADFLVAFTKRESIALEHAKEIRERYETNRDLWKNTKDDNKRDSEQRIINEIFQSVETLIPIVASKVPEPSIKCSPRNMSSFSVQDKMTRYLKDEWEISDKMQQQLQAGIRNAMFAGILIGGYIWDKDEERSVFTIKHPCRVAFPKGFSNINELPYLIEYPKISIRQAKELFPKEKVQLICDKRQMDAKRVDDNAVITIKKYSENENIAYIYDNIKLLEEENPNFDAEKKSRNHFKTPQKAYIVTSFLSTGENLDDETTLIEQAKPLDEAVNKRKRQIDKNTDMATGKYIVAGGKVKQGDVEDFIDNGLVLYLPDQETTAGAVEQFLGRQMDAGTFNDMTHSEQKLDNIFGTHSTTRGERDAQETATGRAILKDSDRGRMDTIVKNIEQFAEEYNQAKIQMLKIHAPETITIFTEPSTTDSLKDSEMADSMVLTKKEIEKYSFTCVVKNGYDTSTDPQAMKETAVDLTLKGKMALKDMYRILGFPNPDKLARNAIMEATNPVMVYPEITNPDKFEPEAIKHTLEIINGETTGSAEIDIMQSEDPELLAKHLETHLEYTKGVEIFPGIKDVSTLTPDQRNELGNHIMKEKINLQELASQMEQAGQMPTQQPQPVMQQEAAPIQQSMIQNPVEQMTPQVL